MSKHGPTSVTTCGVLYILSEFRLGFKLLEYLHLKLGDNLKPL